MVSILALSVTYGATSPKGRGLGKEMDFAWTAKGSHFEERLPPTGTDSPRPGRNVTVGDKEGNGCRISGKRGNLSSVCETERARTLTEENYSSSVCSVCSSLIGGGSASSRCCSARFCASCKSCAACTLARNSSKYIAL